LHGDDSRSFVKTLRNQDIPRATSAVESTKFPPVAMQGETVLGEDPYQAVRPKKETGPAAQPKPSWTPAPKALPVNPGETQVRRAEPVGPLDHQGTPPPVELPTPEHLDVASDPTDL
ncbi:MAG TPA: hypothetical protein VK673_19180, partial [Chthoniobacterales bacterium]|nr:hypothetical protein [Chthoniobacterales bacterium]